MREPTFHRILFKTTVTPAMSKINPMIIKSSAIPFFPILSSGKTTEFAASENDRIIAPIITPQDAIT